MTVFDPELSPATVSRFLGVEGSVLPRLTTQTIGHPAAPSRKRGATGRYSQVDAMLIKLGLLLNQEGVGHGYVQQILRQVRSWIEEVCADPRAMTNEVVFMRRSPDHRQWLVAGSFDGKYNVRLIDGNDVIDWLMSDDLARPMIVVNLTKFLGAAYRDLMAVLEPETSASATAS